MTVSAGVMIFLLVHKRMEQSSAAKTAIYRMRQKTDSILRDLHRTTDDILSHVNLRNIILSANRFFVFIVRFFMHVSHRTHVVLSAIVERASKKKENISRAGAASFYMKQIKETEAQSGASEKKM